MASRGRKCRSGNVTSIFPVEQGPPRAYAAKTAFDVVRRIKRRITTIAAVEYYQKSMKKTELELEMLHCTAQHKKGTPEEQSSQLLSPAPVPLAPPPHTIPSSKNSNIRPWA